MDKPFSAACERNKRPILEKLIIAFAQTHHVLEIGSGTGQHAIFFAEHLQHLIWQTSDLPENHASILSWIKETALANVLPPIALDVRDEVWPVDCVSGVFSANTAHIMGWSQVQNMFGGIGKILSPNGVFCLYGPFNYNGKYTSSSNAHFDAQLREIDPQMGIRDFEMVQKLADQEKLVLQNDYAMPANNRLLQWKKT